MTIRNVTEAKAELSSLLVMAENGEDVVISRAGKPVVQLVPVRKVKKPRKPGFATGKVWISPDFDAHDPEIEKLFYGE